MPDFRRHVDPEVEKCKKLQNIKNCEEITWTCLGNKADGISESDSPLQPFLPELRYFPGARADTISYCLRPVL